MKIKVIEHKKSWANDFLLESRKIKNILSKEIIEVYHIGSTSIPGIVAKPIIDIMPVVKNIENIHIYNAEFEKLGYECMGKYGIERRRSYRKGKEERSHHIHIFGLESKYDIERHLAFRDYLRDNHDLVLEYGQLKKELAKKYPDDIDSYCEGKNSFIKK